MKYPHYLEIPSKDITLTENFSSFYDAFKWTLRELQDRAILPDDSDLFGKPECPIHGESGGTLVGGDAEWDFHADNLYFGDSKEPVAQIRTVRPKGQPL